MKFVLGVLVTLLLLPVLVYLYVRSGYVPVATAAPPFPFERKLAQTALRARVARETLPPSPVPPTPENLLAGARLYRDYCSVCHGLPGGSPTPTAHGMYPPPPQLFHGKGVSDDPVGVTWWKVSNGIRLTGMPAYGPSLGATELWQVSQLLANSRQLPPEAAALLSPPK